MIDREAMKRELQEAKLAWLDAEAANTDLEELIWEVQHVKRQRIVFSIAGLDPELPLAVN